jgi:hypothetical protein
MAPALLVELGSKAFRWPRCGFFVAHVARRARHPSAPAIAAVRALPRPSRVVLANPAGVCTEDAFHSALNPIGRMGGGDVRDVHHGVLDAMGVNRRAARASHQRTGFLRRHPLAGFPHRIFPHGPIPRIAPRLKIGLGSFRQEPMPSILKIGPGLLEGWRRAVLMLTRMRAGIEATGPAPRVLVEGNAGADLDRARVNVAPASTPRGRQSISGG